MKRIKFLSILLGLPAALLAVVKRPRATETYVVATYRHPQEDLWPFYSRRILARGKAGKLEFMIQKPVNSSAGLVWVIETGWFS